MCHIMLCLAARRVGLALRAVGLGLLNRSFQHLFVINHTRLLPVCSHCRGVEGIAFPLRFGVLRNYERRAAIDLKWTRVELQAILLPCALLQKWTGSLYLCAPLR